MHTLKTRTFALLASGALLTACATTPKVPIDTPPVDMVFFSSVAKNNANKFDMVEVRTRSIKEVDGKKTRPEIVGARCNLSGNGYKASFTTPAQINLPLYLGRTDPVTANCFANGDSANASLKARNVTATTRPPAIGGGIAGIIVSAAVTSIAKAARNPRNDVFDYPSSMTVPFGDKAQAE